jgi:hypothetical protein
VLKKRVREVVAVPNVVSASVDVDAVGEEQHEEKKQRVRTKAADFM